MTKEVIYKCRHCKVLFLKQNITSEACPVCDKPDWSLKPRQVLDKNKQLVGTVEHGTDGLITFFPEKPVPWNIRQLANLIKSMAEYD
jgi:hypothetical protein